ncbi:MAG: hypothetical protein GEU80_03230 [Dehalococcoidia bacterium]|nr:hypothetical protein [Dehalococcoidia bacterium]
MPDYDQQTSDLLDRFHQLKDQIGMLRSEQSILRDLKDVLKELKAATLSGNNLQQDVALSNALAILKLVEPRLGKLFTARGWVRGVDAGVSILLGASEDVSAADRLRLMADYLNGLSALFSIPGAGAIFQFYVRAIQPIAEFVPAIEARAQEAARAAREGIDYGATPPETAGSDEAPEVDARIDAIDGEVEAVEEQLGELRAELREHGIEDPDGTFSTRQQYVSDIVNRALSDSGLLQAWATLQRTDKMSPDPRVLRGLEAPHRRGTVGRGARRPPRAGAALRA